MVGAILQARMGSSRFPGKVMSSLVGRPLISHIVERVQATHAVGKIIIATTRVPGDDILETFAKHTGIHCYRGEVNDVLNRFYYAATQYELDNIVRICCDDPLIDP